MKANIVRTWFSVSIFCALVTLSAWSEEYNNKSGEVTVPDSMEIIKKGDVNVIVPKGQRLIPDSSFFVTENPDEYASRKFIEAEARADRIEKELTALKEGMEDLKKAVDSMKREKDAGGTVSIHQIPQTEDNSSSEKI